MLYAFSCGLQPLVHVLLLHTLFLQRTQFVRYWLMVTQDVLLFHVLVSALNKKKNQSCNLINRLISCCFLHTVTHLPHFFVAVVSKVQVVCCYDFIASVIIIIWICWKSETEYINIRWSFLFAPKERNGRSCQVCQNSFLQSGSVQPNYKEAYSLWYAACRKFQYFVPRFCDIRL